MRDPETVKWAGADPEAPANRFFPALKAGVLLALLLLAFLGLRHTQAGAYLSKARIQAVVTDFGMFGPIAHAVIFAVGTTALVPATAFALVGAVVFGKLLGTVYNVAGATAGAVLSFLVARHLGRDFVAQWVTGKRLRDLDARAAQHGFRMICYLRLAYVPFAPLNYGAGLTRIRFSDYFLGTVVGLFPPMFIFTYFLDELTSLGSAADLWSTRFLIPLGLFALSWLLPMLIKRLTPGLNSTESLARDEAPRG
jgi:uncharacterized membrane protein YdjX (TVP38/TMEM64 family)